jgi:hypothetical protein
MTHANRRRFLKGMMHGSAVVVGVPLLDLFLDGNGEALAAGAPIPTRFGTWFWGCGVNDSRWTPDKLGRDYDLKPELTPIGPYKDKVTVLSGFNCILDGKPNLPHWSGVMATFTGAAPSRGGMGTGRSPMRSVPARDSARSNWHAPEIPASAIRCVRGPRSIRPRSTR